MTTSQEWGSSTKGPILLTPPPESGPSPTMDTAWTSPWDPEQAMDEGVLSVMIMSHGELSPAAPLRCFLLSFRAVPDLPDRANVWGAGARHSHPMSVSQEMHQDTAWVVTNKDPCGLGCLSGFHRALFILPDLDTEVPNCVYGGAPTRATRCNSL